MKEPQHIETLIIQAQSQRKKAIHLRLTPGYFKNLASLNRLWNFGVKPMQSGIARK